MSRVLLPFRSLVAVSAALLTSVVVGQAETANWLPVLETEMIIPEGSPLDFSAFLANDPIDEKRRLRALPDGDFGFEGLELRGLEAQKPDRLFCASLAWSPASGGFPDHAEADIYARQLALHGYNAARLHFVDASLMHGQQGDFNFNPEVFDRIQYLIGALKREGIYWVIDGMTSWRGAYGGYDDRWDPNGNLKLKVFFDPEAKAHWQRLVRDVLTAENPYTGLRPIDDPALALVVLNNENSIEFDSVVHERFLRAHYDDILKAPFNTWLRQQYTNTDALQRAWGDLGMLESLENGTVGMPRNRYLDSPRMRDFQAFLVDAERRSYRELSDYLRQFGYQGLISTYNNWPTVQASLSRVDLDVVTMNTYHDWVNGYHPGAELKQTSSIELLGDYYRAMAATRWLDKPFLVTEWDHLFWNKYRYEAGVMMPAYAALQDWDGLCRHGHGPIILRYGEPVPHKRAILPYAIAMDPIARAAEKLAALLFRREDVSASELTVALQLNGVEDLTEDMQAREPDFVTRFALFAKFGLATSAQTGDADLVVGLPRSQQDPWTLWQTLKRSTAFPNGNQTDPERGIYQSSTGEILLDQSRGTLTLDTKRTDAAAFSDIQAPLEAGDLTITGASTGAMLSVSVIDEAPSIAESRKLLLIFATDARNTNMRFQDAEERVIDDFGALPVLIKEGEVNLTVSGDAESWSVKAVQLDGVVAGEVASGKGAVSLRLSNNAAGRPTTYFLIERAGLH